MKIATQLKKDKTQKSKTRCDHQTNDISKRLYRTETHIEEQGNRDCQPKLANVSSKKLVLFVTQRAAQHKKANTQLQNRLRAKWRPFSSSICPARCSLIFSEQGKFILSPPIVPSRFCKARRWRGRRADSIRQSRGISFQPSAWTRPCRSRRGFWVTRCQRPCSKNPG